MAAELDCSDSGKTAGVAFDFPASDSPPASPHKVPVRLRRRLRESPENKNRSPSSLEEIQAKLKEADLRRQQFHDWLSSKARPKPRSPSWSSSQDEDLAQRLEAKLNAAEQKRLSILFQAQMRLARLDEVRQAAKTGVKLRVEKEREELGSKVESRVQQAEANRMLLLEADKQRRATAQERSAQSLLQRMLRENKYKERVRTAIFQKRAAAEKKRLGLIEAEKMRARSIVMQARRVAKSVCHQREIERRRMKDKLEDRLQRAKKQRAEYLRLRGSPQSSTHPNWHKMYKHGDFLSRKLARCWRQFRRSRKTTFALAKAYEALGINERSVKSMPFEQLALCIESVSTLQTVKALLDRFESRFMLSQGQDSKLNSNNIDHLLKRLASPNRRGTSSNTTKSKGTKKASGKGSNKEAKPPEANRLMRYPVRVVLCAYMILGHPDAVFSGQGEREVSLAESATNFIREFELLVKIVLEGPTGSNGAGLTRPSSPDAMSENWDQVSLPSQSQLSFRSQLAAFDSAWRSYLYRFVAWKVNDARLLEDDLVRAACQLELSMMQTCKVTPEGTTGNLSHDMKAIQKQVSDDQQLLREKVQHLSGSAGIERMEFALSDTRSKFFEAKENGSPFASQLAQLSSSPPKSPTVFSSIYGERKTMDAGGKPGSVVRSLFKDVSPPKAVSVSPMFGEGQSSKLSGEKPKAVSVSPVFEEGQSDKLLGEKPISENELLVNEIVHEGSRAFTDNLNMSSGDNNSFEAGIKETMEKAFWDGIIDSMRQDEPDYSRVIELVKEVRDELCEMAPQSWRQEILEAIDVDILLQVLNSGTLDTDYLGRILEYALVTLQKLSAPANDDEIKRKHQNLLRELVEITQTGGESNSSFAIATIKGLCFVLKQIQALKQEVSAARIQLMEPLISGPAGLEYLQKAFGDRCGPPSEARQALPRTVEWLASVRDDAEQEWNEHIYSLSSLGLGQVNSVSSQCLPPATSLKTGGSIPGMANQTLPVLHVANAVDLPECKGERVDLFIRLGLAKLACAIEGVTEETLPETLRLNCSRLRGVQGQLQRIIVISTSMLVLRQFLPSENPKGIEMTVSDCGRRLSELLDSMPTAGMPEIVETLETLCSESGADSCEERRKARMEMMGSMLAKSLLSGDAIFFRVARAVYLAMRAIVLCGSSAHGQSLAEAELRRVGAIAISDQLVAAASALAMMAVVSVRVHGPWYGCLVAENI